MKRSLLGATTSLLLALSLAGCSNNPAADSQIESLLSEAKQADAASDFGQAEAKLTLAISRAEEGAEGVLLMRALNAYGTYYVRHKQSEKSEKYFQRALSAGNELAEKTPAIKEQSEYQTEYVIAAVGLANFERELGRVSTATRLFLSAKEFHEKLGAQSPLKDSFDDDYNRCLQDSRLEEEAETQSPSAKGEGMAAKKAFREKYFKAYQSLDGGYMQRPPEETVKGLADLATEIKRIWSVEDSLYVSIVQRLARIADLTGDFSTLDKQLQSDAETLKSVAKLVKEDRPIPALEIPEIGDYIELLIRRADVDMLRPDIPAAKASAETAVRLARQYFAEDVYRLESSLETLARVEQLEGDYSNSSKHAEEALKIANRVAARGPKVTGLFYYLGSNQVNEGQLPKAIETARTLRSLIPNGEIGFGVCQMFADSIVFDVAMAFGDIHSAAATNAASRKLTAERPRLDLQFRDLLDAEESRLLLKQGKFAELVAAHRAQLPDKKFQFRPWLRENDLLAYAALRSGDASQASLFATNVESAKTDSYTRALYLTRLVRVWLRSNAKQKVDAELKKLFESVETLRGAKYLEAVDPMVALAGALVANGNPDAAEKVYSCALRAYDLVPGRIDKSQIEALKAYRAFLEKQKRQDQVWQIKTRLEQRMKKLETVGALTKEVILRK